MKPIYAILILIALFSVMCAVSWITWANPVIDDGREMNTPLRLLHGEELYSQVYYLYGPVAPFFNALLFKIFGVHLNVLYAAGIAGSLLLVLMIFYVARRFMTVSEATLVAVAVILFSIFKQGGDLVFPYSYSALYGTILGVLALIAQINFARSRRIAGLYVGGALAGLAFCCKFEFGIAAAASLIALIFSAPRGQRTRLALISLATFAIFPIAIYGLLFARIPSDAILKDTFILPGYIPSELVNYNLMKLGLNYPGRTLREMINALALLVVCGGSLLLLGIRMTGKSIAFAGAEPRLRRIWKVTLACAGLMLVHCLAFLFLFRTHWDLNPFRALPILFLGMIWFCARTPDGSDENKALRRSLLIVSVYSLTVLVRVITRIPAGGAYGSGLLPIPLVLFVYLSAVRLPAYSISPEAGHRTRRAAALLLAVAMVAMLGVIVFRENKFDYLLRTPRGNMRLQKPLGAAMDQALHFISRASNPDDYILALPEGSSLNFLADRPAPLRYEIVTPGFLTESAERQSIQSIQEKKVRYIFLFNRPTTEFGAKAIGKDYCRTLMGWIEENYAQAAVFGENVSPDAGIGDEKAPFFIKCYARR